ncbi:ATP-grasp domain-containing protein [Amycolatopsis solani]|uniref:ATP-grasp domain-containing protein n=1 Tax=Amycolatopsis solani TaxID=3028615 RepID=UPI0025B12498|nr:ATP-grasp domain-containing protein [Amycolatopsis sp. MEP2-6]
MSILILHTSNASRRRHLARAAAYAKQHGERLILIMENPGWEREFADRVVAADTSDIATIVAAARALAEDEQEALRGVVTFVEHSVPAAAAVAAALGLPFVSERTARVARDKYAMRRAFAAWGVPQPAFGLAATLDEARTTARRIGFPLVMKPLIGGGSMYVRRVDDVAELAEHFEPIKQGAWDAFGYDPLHESALAEYRGAILLEAYQHGSEFSVESLVVGGETHVVAIHDKPLPMNGPYFEEVCYTTPSRLPAEVEDRVREITALAHRALDIRMGATHTEFRIQDGAEPMILETGARLGGGPVYQSLLLSTGVDMVAGVLDLARGEQPDLTPRPEPTPTGFYLFFAEKAGRIKAIHGVDETTGDPCVRELALYRSVGDVVDVPPDAGQAHGHVVFTADTVSGLGDVFDRLVKTIRLEIA